MFGSRLTDLAFILMVIALGVSYFQRQLTEEPPLTKPAATAATTTATSIKMIKVGQKVPSFELAGGGYEAGSGPYLVVLTATGCGGCLERIDGTDRSAYEMAKAEGLEVWNLLVYHPDSGREQFVAVRNPSADRVSSDPRGEFSVRTLGGSDATCWMLIDGQGKLVWRGPAKLKALEEALLLI